MLSNGFAFDIETTSDSMKKKDNLHFKTARPVCIGVAWIEDGRILTDVTTDLQKYKAELENPDIPKVGHNIKFDCKILFGQDIKVQGIKQDTSLGYKLLNENDPASLDAIVKREFGVELSKRNPYKAWNLRKVKKCWERHPQLMTKLLMSHCREDCYYTLKLAIWLKEKMSV